MELHISLSLKYMLFLSAAILPVGIVVAFAAMVLFTLYMVQSFQWVHVHLSAHNNGDWASSPW